MSGLRLLTAQETAEILRVPLARVYELVRRRFLPACHLGRQIRVEEESLRQFIQNGGKAWPGGWKREIE